MTIEIENADAYLTDDMGMIDATRQEMKYAVVSVRDNVSSLLALFMYESDAQEFSQRGIREHVGD